MIDRNGNRAFGLSRTAETAISKKSGKTYRVVGGALLRDLLALN